MSPSDCLFLPTDADRALLLGRIWRTDTAGAILIELDAAPQLEAYRRQRPRYWHGR